MKLFMVIIEDRHADVKAHPFSDAEKAIETAKRVAKNLASHEDDYEEHDYQGWLFCAVYSCEGDCVRVVETELDKEI